MPLPAGPNETRLPARSSNVAMPLPARAMKNSGPRFIGATIRKSIGALNGAIRRFGEELNIPTPENKRIEEAVLAKEARLSNRTSESRIPL